MGNNKETKYLEYGSATAIQYAVNATTGDCFGIFNKRTYYLFQAMDMKLFYRVKRVNKQVEIPFSSLTATLNICAGHS